MFQASRTAWRTGECIEGVDETGVAGRDQSGCREEGGLCVGEGGLGQSVGAIKSIEKDHTSVCEASREFRIQKRLAVRTYVRHAALPFPPSG